MTESIKFPSQRQPAVEEGPTGMVMSRPWFLFFQQIFERVGGSISMSNTDIETSLFEDAGNGEIIAMIQTASKSAGQDPAITPLIETISSLVTEIAQLRDTVAELSKTVDGIRQS